MNSAISSKPNKSPPRGNASPLGKQQVAGGAGKAPIITNASLVTTTKAAAPPKKTLKSVGGALVVTESNGTADAAKKRGKDQLS